MNIPICSSVTIYNSLRQGSCSFHCQGGNLGKNSILPTVSSSFIWDQSACMFPGVLRVILPKKSTLSLRDDFFFFGCLLLWVRIIFLQGSFPRCLLLTYRVGFWMLLVDLSGVVQNQKGAKSCPSGRTRLSSTSSTSPCNFGVPSAEDPGQNHSVLFPLQGLPPSAVHWNFMFSPCILSCNSVAWWSWGNNWCLMNQPLLQGICFS